MARKCFGSLAAVRVEVVAEIVVAERDVRHVHGPVLVAQCVPLQADGRVALAALVFGVGEGAKDHADHSGVASAGLCQSGPLAAYSLGCSRK